jgi:hypothetical protein
MYPVRQIRSFRNLADIRVQLLTAGVLMAASGGDARAVDLLGLYVGGAIGRARVEATVPNPVTGSPALGDFNEDHSAYKIMVGARPISLVGAEIAYFDFGHPSGIAGSISGPFVPATHPVPAEVTMRGAAAFGVLFLPVPIVDVYGKIGFARVRTTAESSVQYKGPILCIAPHPDCRFSWQNSATNTGLALGAGAQYKVGSWAVRFEYERFHAAGENPSLLSLGLTWSFL